LFVFQGRLSACFCGSSYTGINSYSSTVLTIPAETLERGKFVFGYAFNFQNYNSFSRQKFASINRKGVHSHSFDSILTQSLNLSYGITDDFSIMGVFPFRKFSGLKSTAEGITIDDGDSIGVGDFSFLAKYRFLKGKTFSLALLGGIKIPSGDTNQKNEFGFPLGADEQPGSGSWDPILGIAASKHFREFDLHSNILYRLSTLGSQDSVVGDRVNFNLGLSKNLKHGKFLGKKILPSKIFGQNLNWTLISEANGIWTEKLEIDGTKDPNHGGLVIFLSPGIQLNINDRLFNSFFMSFPVIQDLNGLQSDLNFQIGFNTSLLL
jgi:hypothetical protein